MCLTCTSPQLDTLSGDIRAHQPLHAHSDRKLMPIIRRNSRVIVGFSYILGNLFHEDHGRKFAVSPTSNSRKASVHMRRSNDLAS